MLMTMTRTIFSPDFLDPPGGGAICRPFGDEKEVITMKIRNMSCDLETYSSVNIAKAGVYRYAESSDFEILLFAYRGSSFRRDKNAVYQRTGIRRASR